MTSFVNKNMQSNNVPGPPIMQDSRTPYIDSAVKGDILSLRHIPRAMEDRMTGTSGDESRKEFHLWRVNLFEIPRGLILINPISLLSSLDTARWSVGQICIVVIDIYLLWVGISLVGKGFR